MTTHQRDRRNFDERLLGELRTYVASQPPEAERPPHLGGKRVASRHRRRLVLAGGMVLALAVAAGAGVPFLTGGAEPAYAVNDNGDGTVTIEITSLEDATGLQRELREAGVPAVVEYLPPGKACKQPWFTPASPQGDSGAQSTGIQGSVQGSSTRTGAGGTEFTISANLPPGQTLVIMTQVGESGAGQPKGEGPGSIAIAVAQGEVGPCEVVDAPAGSQPFGLEPRPDGTLHTERGEGGVRTSVEPAGSTASGR